MCKMINTQVRDRVWNQVSIGSGPVQVDQEYIRRDAIISHLKVVYLISTMHEMMVSLTGFGLKAFGLGRHPSFVGGSKYGREGLVYTMEVYHRCAILQPIHK